MDSLTSSYALLYDCSYSQATEPKILETLSLPKSEFHFFVKVQAKPAGSGNKKVVCVEEKNKKMHFSFFKMVF